MKRFVILAALGVTACAPQILWEKPGATQQDFAKDSYQCEKDARQSGYFGGPFEVQSFLNRCMVAAGWALQSNSSQLPYTPRDTSRDVKCKFPNLDQAVLRSHASACTTAGGTVIP